MQVKKVNEREANIAPRGASGVAKRNPRREREANRLYNIILRQVIKLVGNKTTFLSQLNTVGKQLLGVKFKGVFPSDEIPKLTNRTPYCILNLDKSYEPGSHWIALAKVKKKSIIYDSFGRTHTKIIPNLKYSGNGRILDTDLDAEQKITEQSCGARSIGFLVFLDKYGPEMALLI